MYKPKFEKEWSRYFYALDEGIKERVAKKIDKILEYPNKRHLKKSSFFVDEVGQFRIVYMIFEEDKLVVFYFVGTHKEYEKWYTQEF